MLVLKKYNFTAIEQNINGNTDHCKKVQVNHNHSLFLRKLTSSI